MNYEILMFTCKKGEKKIMFVQTMRGGILARYSFSNYLQYVYLSFMLFNILKKDDRIKGTVNQSFIYHYDSMDFEVSGFLQMEFDLKKIVLAHRVIT